MRLLGLPDALRAYGLEPVLVAGWETRGAAFLNAPVIHLRHWTAGAPTGLAPSLGTVTHGRSDLPGPLAQVLQERSGRAGLDRVYVVASGVANHAGIGAWLGVLSGNREGTGNEVEWSGPAEPFGGNRIETSERVAAALQSLRPSPNGLACCEHREYALPPGRKIDTNLNGQVFRSNVKALLARPNGAFMALTDDEQKELLLSVREASSSIRAMFIGNWIDPNGFGDLQWLERITKGVVAEQLKPIAAALAAIKVEAIAQAVVKALPPSAGGSAPTLAQIEDVVGKAINSQLGFLKPGQ